MGKRWILKESESSTGKGCGNPPSPRHRPTSSWKARLPEPVVKDGVRKVEDERMEEGEPKAVVEDKKNFMEKDGKNVVGGVEGEVDQEMDKMDKKKKERKETTKEKKAKKHKKEKQEVASGSTESRKAMKTEEPVDKSWVEVKAELSPTEPDEEMTNEELNERLQAALQAHGVYRYISS